MNQPDEKPSLPVSWNTAKVPLPNSARQSIELLETMLGRALRGEIDEVNIIAITTGGALITAFSECQSVIRTGGALVSAGMQRMGFTNAGSDEARP